MNALLFFLLVRFWRLILASSFLYICLYTHIYLFSFFAFEFLYFIDNS